MVDWLIENNFCETREEAMKLGKGMLQNDIFHHVAYDHTFKDEYLFYRFPVCFFFHSDVIINM